MAAEDFPGAADAVRQEARSMPQKSVSEVASMAETAMAEMPPVTETAVADVPLVADTTMPEVAMRPRFSRAERSGRQCCDGRQSKNNPFHL